MKNVKKNKGRYSLKYFFAEGIHGFISHGFMSFAAISIIVTCLVIVGSVVLMAANIRNEIQHLQQGSQIAIYIDDHVSREDAIALKSKIISIDNVLSADFISKEQGLMEFKNTMGDSALFDGLVGEHNPLRDGYKIYMKDISKFRQTVSELEKIDEVANVVEKQDTALALLKVQKVFDVISAGLIISLGCISIFIISNTVKLGMFARRDEIAIMKMVGATNWFIRWPFVIEGLMLGIIGSSIAFFTQWGVYYQIQQVISEIVGYSMIMEFENVMYAAIIGFVTAGVLIGVGGSVLTIRKFLDV